jgi:hypothetical protein
MRLIIRMKNVVSGTRGASIGDRLGIERADRS